MSVQLGPVSARKPGNIVAPCLRMPADQQGLIMYRRCVAGRPSGTV
ncbi:Unknown protein sequence [Pseudomonas syringae pv. cilantro]|uniref:Uncharacterized protein n=1 Tax=Pseudomonas syringae pv. cilantro TaxID=81035 RepID=A0A0N0GFG8_PSESX|nr:Unknown protein sequence [Pseudomonas syringae pv. cilantro]